MKKIIFILFSLIIANNSFAQHALGALLLTSQEYAALPHLNLSAVGLKKLLAPLPPVMTITSPPVGDQGSEGACVGWGVGYSTISSLWVYPTTIYNSSNELSPSYIYNQIKQGNCAAGSYVKDALNLIASQGDCSIGSMPYVDGDCNTQPNSNQRAEAHTKIVAGWFALAPTDVNAMKISIWSKTPVIVAFNVTQAFDTMWANGGIWTTNGGTARGGHCVAIIGYDDTKGMFKAQNQWGVSGGDHGFFWVTYALVQSGCFQEAYSFSDAFKY
ncbi:C1 family peptidase [Mucilaginibacter sp. L196]|uniref:C1 family peptidase n=1 Tax=Mucilaginibacter sp. L196 TaxID=1641870 RepID=UPI00131AD580|nr:C1 family peptidase [Mucilaginibacter sp. L196]